MALGGKHTLPGFEQTLESLRTDGALMGALVSRSLTNAKLGFTLRSDDHCAAVIADDEEVDLLEKQIDRTGTDILMRYQPLAFDLRNVLATIKLSSHLENLSDQAVTIARRVRWLNEDQEYEDKQLVVPIFELAESGLLEVLQAFSAVDSLRAHRVRSQMEPLAQSSRELEEHFSSAVAEHPARSRSYVNLIAIGHCLEHIAYLIESIAEEAIYMAEAKDVRHPGNRLAEE
ncbi:MAG: PhoU domain-containing protein [Chthoniobacterales bacterium]